MAWTAPMTFVANTALTSAQMNVYVRDNMMETAPAKATTAGGYFVGTGPNGITERVGQAQTLTTIQTITDTSYADAPTDPGPTVTATTGTQALVIIGCEQTCSTVAAAMRMTVDVTGATTLAGTDTRSICTGTGVSNRGQFSLAIWYNTLTPGLNTFTCKYRVTGGTANTFDSRRLIVLPY